MSRSERDEPPIVTRNQKKGGFYSVWWCSEFSGRAVCAGVGRRPSWVFWEGSRACLLFCLGYKLVVSFTCGVPRLFSFARCFALEGLSCSDVVFVFLGPPSSGTC
ncbi:hypothetical protein Taro_023188 [Colocasia esculenta]|uniref:Uncharacterized protein n=1 Tax=Colocasia esculenta TaxID=4460 RepID=A0A843V3J3_COLES|nr:hypothetical protein [Colocasia esculenta]